MTIGQDALSCVVAARRRKLFGNPNWNGIDFVEVSDDQLSLCVYFFGDVPDGVSVDNIMITGGRRIRGIRAVDVRIRRAADPDLDDCLKITVDKPGDFSVYRLCLTEAARGQGRPLPGLDPRYSCADFTFKIAQDCDLDCLTEAVCQQPPLPAPDINYLAKDYESFRQLLLDRLAVIMPGWAESHVPDIGITLVELLAYAGDYLSYYQDAVATEAYLDTARQRISVRRHARLVDYRMHEGCNARAFVCVQTDTDLDPLAASAFFFITGVPGIPATSGQVVRAADLEGVPASSYEVFEPLAADPGQVFEFLSAHSEIQFYTWGDEECCLAAGATHAALLDEAPPAKPPPGEPVAAAGKQRVLRLKPGDVLIFEEVIGPTTGNPADADTRHRHAVRLTQVTQAVDELFGRLVVEVTWAQADALPFPVCVSSRLPAPDCRRVENVSVARGNVVLVEYGRSVTEPCGPVGSLSTTADCACDGSVLDQITLPQVFRPVLAQGPVSFAEPLEPSAPASRMLAQDPRRALAELSLTEYADGDTGTPTGPAWQPVPDLLQSLPENRSFVAEVDDDGMAHLRFGDGDLGRQPDASVRFQASYRVGNGPAGNVGHDSISYLVMREGTFSGGLIQPRNPLPATGGTAPELTAEVKLMAPSAFRSRRERAITAADYAELAARNPRLQGAAAELRWTGSWYEARVAVDPVHSEQATTGLLDAVAGYLYHYRRTGHDLHVEAAQYVPLALTMDVCVLPDATAGAVEGQLLRVLGNRRLPDSRLGFFHPDNLTFGQDVRVSKLVAAAMSVAGVDTVKVTELRRLGEPDSGAAAAGVLPLASMEIAQLDNDPDFPENGVLTLHLEGGR
jgi:hypothetical protein